MTLAAGASAAAIGTAFMLCPEAGTSHPHREALRGDGPTRLTRAFTGRRGRGIVNLEGPLGDGGSSGGERPIITQAEESAIAALGKAKFDVEFSAGKRLSRDSAVALALGEPHPTTAATRHGAVPGALAKREVDVARLVADGLTNKQIGARLFISERTVDSHVRSILNKLGFNSRAQIAGWMASANQ